MIEKPTIRIKPGPEIWDLEMDMLCFGTSHLSPERQKRLEEEVAPQIISEVTRIYGEIYNALTLG